MRALRERVPAREQDEKTGAKKKEESSILYLKDRSLLEKAALSQRCGIRDIRDIGDLAAQKLQVLPR